jgi:hypothetical protein
MAKAAISQDMATPDSWTPSRRMRSAAAAERDRVERELARLDARREALLAQLTAVDTGREELREQLRVLHRFLQELPNSSDDNGPRLRAVPSPASGSSTPGIITIRGACIRETAVRVLAGAPEARGPVHYRTWFELFTRQGFMPVGKDPLATFLTQIGRSPVIERTSAGGTYQLDFGFPREARQRLTDLRTALHATHELPPNAGIDAITAARERRAKITSEIEATERALEEALRSLGDTEP